MDHATAEKFAASWADAWNAHDLERVLGHFAEDVVFASPVAAQLIEGSDGVLRGKAALRDYWARGLRAIPDLHFTVLDVYAGVSAVVIGYRNQKGARVSEVLIFDGPLVVEGHGTYLGADPDPAGAAAG
ncbi:MAG TPA: nuclear transport factor 2 family protein [Streptosporangiaceae bacterium]